MTYFFPPSSKYLIYPFIRGKITHKGLIICSEELDPVVSLFKYPQKCLYVVSLSFHLLETTILLKSMESNKIASLDE